MQAVVRQESGSAPKEEDDKRFSHAQKMVSKLSEEVSEQKERLKHLGNGYCECSCTHEYSNAGYLY
jgi:hypothetical protein